MEKTVYAMLSSCSGYDVHYYDFEYHGVKPVIVIDYNNNGKQTEFNDYDDAADFIEQIIEYNLDGVDCEDDRYNVGYDNECQ